MKKLLSLLAFILLANHAAHAQRTILATDATGKFPPGTIASNVFPKGLELGIRGVPFVFDSDAQAYIDRVPIVDPVKALKIHQFIAGIKALGICTNVGIIADFRNNVGTGTTAYSITGNDITLQAGVTWSTNGLEFSGSTGVYASFVNNLGSTLSEYTIIAAFNAGTSTPSAETIIGGNGDSHYGPALLAHGSERQAGTALGWLFHDWGTAATTDVGSVNFAGRVAKDRGASGYRQIAFATKSSNSYSLQSGMERVWATTGTIAAAYNGASEWRIGSDLDGNNRLTGSVAFVAVIRAQLTQSQIQNFRRLYQSTIGDDYLPRINLIAEGDSLTSGANGIGGWTDNLQTNSVWGPRIHKRIVATGGDTLSQMFSQVNSQVGVWAHEWRNADKTWVILWGGANDVNSSSPEVISGWILLCAQNYRNLGFKVAGCTIIPSAGHNGTGATTRATVNAALKSNPAAFYLDALVKLDEVPELQTTSNTTYFQGDGIHLTVAGAEKVAQKIVSTIPTP